MAFYDLSHTHHKQVTSVSPACFGHPTVENFDVYPNISFLPKQIVVHGKPTKK